MILSVDGFVVYCQRGFVPGTWLLSAWEPTCLSERKYGVLRRFANREGYYGRLGSAKIPQSELSPGDPRRGALVALVRDEAYEQAYRLICQVFPDACQGMASTGFISLVGSECPESDGLKPESGHS